MNKNCLACQIHPEVRCDICKKQWCTECTLINPMYFAEPNRMCIGCYRKSTISRPKKNGGMSLRELFREARKVRPKGYMSVSATIEDHRPGANKPEVEWNIFHEIEGHFQNYNQRRAYEEFCKKCDVQPKKHKKREDII